VTTEHENYCIGFKAGDETALSYIYRRYYDSLFHHGKKILNDDFAVSCIVQEAFLKGWKFRETMESMRHIYCFIRLDITWKCYAYLKNPANRFYRHLVEYGSAENYYAPCEEPEENSNIFNEERFKVIEEALPYLPGNSHTIMTLYFKHGFSYKKIARRFGTSNQAISVEVHKSLEKLKKIIHAQRRLNVKTAEVSKRPTLTGTGTEIMDPEMQYIFKMRYEQKHSFESIATSMKVSQGYVQQQYVIAHRKLRQLQR
jgi:RNA polymerase sigma factor (sigma-70 family)